MRLVGINYANESLTPNRYRIRHLKQAETFRKGFKDKHTRDNEFRMEFLHPFDILLKFKSLHIDESQSGRETKKGQKAESAKCPVLSGWRDSNSRPRRPERRALTWLRYIPEKGVCLCVGVTV